MWRLCLRLVAFAALCLCTLAQAQSDLFQLSEKRAAIKYCGRDLANVLHIVCMGNYNSMFKKSTLDAKQDDRSYWVQQQQPERQTDEQFPFRSKLEAVLFMNRGLRRERRGVYDECCAKPCTRAELSSYCARR